MIDVYAVELFKTKNRIPVEHHHLLNSFLTFEEANYYIDNIYIKYDSEYICFYAVERLV